MKQPAMPMPKATKARSRVSLSRSSSDCSRASTDGEGGGVDCEGSEVATVVTAGTVMTSMDADESIAVVASGVLISCCSFAIAELASSAEAVITSAMMRTDAETTVTETELGDTPAEAAIALAISALSASVTSATEPAALISTRALCTTGGGGDTVASSDAIFATFAVRSYSA
eukprot:771091-Prymnesium_polylepis.2